MNQDQPNAEPAASPQSAPGTGKPDVFKLESITKGPINCVADLIEEADKLALPLSGSAYPSRWAFRGQSRDFGTLVPSFQRQFTRPVIGAAEIIEHRLIEAFRKHYADLKDSSSDMPSPDRIGPKFDLRCLSVMQHYEIPTRLLDWTSDFWTAIYFACASDPGVQAELWYYDRELFAIDRFTTGEFTPLMDTSPTPADEPKILKRNIGEAIVELDPKITPRMIQQEAHHTVSTNVFSDHVPEIVALQKRVELSSGRTFVFERLLIDGACKSKALQFLADEKNITASTIFPDVVGLGRFLRWQFESLRTMLL